MLPIHPNMKENKKRGMTSVMLLYLVMFLLSMARIVPAEPGDRAKNLETENVTIIMVSSDLADEKARAAIEENKIIMLGFEDVHFDLDRSALTPDARKILKRNLRLLEDNPEIQIRIAGYASASGTQEHNQTLSEQRANAVRDYLINEGLVSPTRLSTIGYGENDPAKSEAPSKAIYSDPEKTNKRVLFEIIVNQGPVQ